MKTTFISKEANVVKFDLAFTYDEFENAVVAAYKKNKDRFTIDGFRKGKAPRKIIENYYGADIFWDEAINSLLQEHYPAAIRELDLDVIDSPKLDLDAVEKGQDVVVKASVEVEPEVEVKDYFGVEVDGVDSTVKDEEVEQELKRVQKSQARLETVEGRKTQDGDIVVIDFAGSIDGKEFEGGSAENFELKLGSGQFIPGFEEQLIGKDSGEEVDVTVTFPEDYHAEELAGKEAVFKTKIHEIKEEILPEIDDDLASDVSEFETLDEYKNSIKENLQKDAETSAIAIIKDSILQKIYKDNRPEVPAVMIEDEMNRMMQEMSQQLAYQGMTIEKYAELFGQTIDSMREMSRSEAENRVGIRLLVKAIAALEKIEVTEEEIEKELEALGKQFGQTAEEARKMVGEANMKYLKEDVSYRKTVDMLYDKAVITEPKKSEEPAEEKAEEE